MPLELWLVVRCCWPCLFYLFPLRSACSLAVDICETKGVFWPTYYSIDPYAGMHAGQRMSDYVLEEQKVKRALRLVMLLWTLRGALQRSPKSLHPPMEGPQGPFAGRDRQKQHRGSRTTLPLCAPGRYSSMQRSCPRMHCCFLGPYSPPPTSCHFLLARILGLVSHGCCNPGRLHIKWPSMAGNTVDVTVQHPSVTVTLQKPDEPRSTVGSHPQGLV